MFSIDHILNTHTWVRSIYKQVGYTRSHSRLQFKRLIYWLHIHKRNTTTNTDNSFLENRNRLRRI
jgi:hypothetical protein